MASNQRSVLNSNIKLNVFLSQGGLGDFICACPALKFLLTEHGHCAYKIWVPDFAAPLIKNILKPYLRPQDSICYWSTMDVAKENGKLGVHMSYQKPHTSLRTHLVDFAYHIFADYSPTGSERDYLPLNTDADYETEVLEKLNLFNKKYVIVTTGYTAPVRQWYPKHINATVDGILERGLVPVFLGKEQVAPGADGKFAEGIDFSKGINLINQTNLLQSGVALKHAQAVVGLDNGLLHLAACTDVPIVMGLSSLYARHRIPQRHGQIGWNTHIIEPEESLPCRGCQSKINFVEHDFRFCYFKDYKCLDQLTADKFLAKLDLCLS